MREKTKILVVDDETSVALMIVVLLTRAGCNAQTAWNAEKALRLAQNDTFDLITLDVNMPGANGFEICRQLKQIPHLRDTPVIFVSGNISKEDQQRALELGAVDYISKPFEVTDFIFRIKSHAKVKTHFVPTSVSEGATT